MKKIVVGFLFFVGLCASAQKKVQLSSTLQTGILEGERGTAFQLKSVNGLAYKTWAAGVGVSIDYYYSRSLPLFLELRKSVGATQKAPFLYMDGGYNFPWLKATEKDGSFKSVTGGLYYDAGVGYQIPVLKNSLLFFSAGYSKKMYKMTDEFFSCPFIGPCHAQTETFSYQLRRLSVMSGLRF